MESGELERTGSNLGIGWNKNHILKHGPGKNEIEAALKGDIYVKRSGDVYLTIGESSGRILFIVLAERGGNKVYPITAHDADKKMKNLYKKRIKT